MARQMYSLKSSAAVFCHEQVRYWIAVPSSEASCWFRMASLDSSPSDEMSSLWWAANGAIRGPTRTPGPPKMDASREELVVGADVDSTSRKPFFDMPDMVNKQWGDLFPDQFVAAKRRCYHENRSSLRHALRVVQIG